MKIRLFVAAAGLLSLAACNEPAPTNATENVEIDLTDVANAVGPETPVSNVTNVTAPEVFDNATADEAQTQEDAVATGMTSRVDRNLTEATE